MDMVGKLLLLLVTVGSACVGAGTAAAERNRKSVTHLKGFDGPLPFSLETGYVEVEETHGVEFFYYFIESQRNPEEDPVILWISGGPGCSGLNALFLENGPLKLDIAGYAATGGVGFPGLLYFEDSWTKVSNVILVDAPVGSGFSYTRETPVEGLNVTLTGVGRQLRVFLHKWMAEHHPELASNPLYIGGSSYSGYTVTVAALEVANDQLLNLVGYIVANARGEVNNDNAGRLPFMHGMGLISDELYEAALGSCAGGWNWRCIKAQQAIREATSDLNMMNILQPSCGADFSPKRPDLGRLSLSRPRPMQLQEGDRVLDLGLILPLECRSNNYNLANRWANDAEVKEMLGVREGSIADGSWVLCPNPPMQHLNNDVRTTIPYHRELTQRGYRALVYNGDHDLVIPFMSTQAWIRSLGYPVVAPWRPWYSKKEVAGFTTEYAYNLTFATVKGAGHMASEDRPKECLDMLQRWISPSGKL